MKKTKARLLCPQVKDVSKETLPMEQSDSFHPPSQ